MIFTVFEQITFSKKPLLRVPLHYLQTVAIGNGITASNVTLPSKLLRRLGSNEKNGVLMHKHAQTSHILQENGSALKKRTF